MRRVPAAPRALRRRHRRARRPTGRSRRRAAGSVTGCSALRATRLYVGDDVAALQDRLLELGFDAGRVDGVFGDETEAALREFQREYGLLADGTCGPATLKALRQLGRTVVGGRPQRCARARRCTARARRWPARSSSSTPGTAAQGGAHRAAASRRRRSTTWPPGSRAGSGLRRLGVPHPRPRRRRKARRRRSAPASPTTPVPTCSLSLHVNRHENPAANGVATYHFGSAVRPLLDGRREAGRPRAARDRLAHRPASTAGCTPRPGSCCASRACPPYGSSSATSPIPATPPGWPTRRSATWSPRRSRPRCSGSTCRPTWTRHRRAADPRLAAGLDLDRAAGLGLRPAGAPAPGSSSRAAAPARLPRPPARTARCAGPAAAAGTSGAAAPS